MSDVSDEMLAELIEWCMPKPNVVQGVKQPRDSWQNLTALLRELQLLRASAPVLSEEMREACRVGAAGLRGDLASMRRIIGGDYGRMHAYQMIEKNEALLRAMAEREKVS